MKKVVLFFTIMCVVQILFAQSTEPLDTILQRIDNRDKVLDENPKLKDKFKLDTLISQVNDYFKLRNMLIDELNKTDIKIDELTKQNNFYNLLLSPRTEVFDIEFPSEMQIPQCLKQHFDIIKKVVVVREAIEKIEKNIVAVRSKCDGLSLTKEEVKEQIKLKIEADVTMTEQLLSELFSMDLSSLSNEQVQYLKPGLTERYNKFLIYFE